MASPDDRATTKQTPGTCENGATKTAGESTPVTRRVVDSEASCRESAVEATVEAPCPAGGDETAAAGRAKPNVRDILDDPVTRHMSSASPLLKVGQTVEQALEQLRTTRELGRVVYFYVVDDDCRLQGVVPSRRLLLATPQTSIREIMSERIVSIPSRCTVLEACEFFTLHKFLAFPVVDETKKVVGAVDVDLYTNEILEIDRRQDSEDLFQLIGVHLSEAAQKSPRLAFNGRFPWLLCNLLGGMLSAFIADAYDDVATLAVVAPFIALVTALAESVSIQSVSLALQALHAQPATWATFCRKAAFEVVVGALLGIACGVGVALIAYVWKRSFAVAMSLMLGIAGGVTASAVVGLSVPFVLRLVRRDPQLASGPIALALSDVVTLLFYFNLGRWVL
ncbi:Magnesium transporter MgtE [Caulifigura coniformis]|uniref:Magnesium transporter MgtE n=1 Tax=Caulifigura coniformis TaxID=2527983 RepID=A0A517SGK3_9PLAN|nr:magnesium transporter [Caulifigura coniformis]QDT55265.1 Magnesium transporter MgtE [Caulifigura coniformis]